GEGFRQAGSFHQFDQGRELRRARRGFDDVLARRRGRGAGTEGNECDDSRGKCQEPLHPPPPCVAGCRGSLRGEGALWLRSWATGSSAPTGGHVWMDVEASSRKIVYLSRKLAGGRRERRAADAEEARLIRDLNEQDPAALATVSERYGRTLLGFLRD